MIVLKQEGFFGQDTPVRSRLLCGSLVPTSVFIPHDNSEVNGRANEEHWASSGQWTIRVV